MMLVASAFANKKSLLSRSRRSPDPVLWLC
jgi:hypothetical protein